MVITLMTNFTLDMEKEILTHNKVNLTTYRRWLLKYHQSVDDIDYRQSCTNLSSICHSVNDNEGYCIRQLVYLVNVN